MFGGLWKSRQPITSASVAQPNTAPSPVPPRPVMAVAAAAVAFGVGMGAAMASPVPRPTAATGAWPVSDTFTGSTGTTLASHAPDSGGTWTLHPSYSGTSVLDAANRLRQNTSTASCYYADATPTTADYDVTADIVRLSNSAFPSTAGIVGRLDTSADTCYTARQELNGSTWVLAKRVAGSETSLGTSSTPSVVTSTPNTVTLRMIGTAIKVLIDGVVRISVTDSSVTAAGKAGVRFTAITSAPTDTTLIHLDNFAANDVPVDPRVVPPSVVSVEPPRPYPGSVVATTARPAAASPFSQPPRLVLASAEPQRPYPGWTLAESAFAVTIAAFDRPPPSLLASAEPPRPYPGSVLARSALPAIIVAFDRPAVAALARSEPPAPYLGSVIATGSRPKIEDVPLEGLIARTEPPAPYAGSALATTAKPAAVPLFDWPAGTVVVQSEAPRPHPGWVFAPISAQDTGAGPGPEAATFIPRRPVIVRARAPIMGAIYQTVVDAGSVPSFKTPPPVLASAEPPAPFAGSVLSSAGKPATIAAFDRPAVPARASIEPPRPDAGSVLLATVRYVVLSSDSTVKATVARSEPPPPSAGSIFAISAKPDAVAPSARPVTFLARAETPPSYPGSAWDWAAWPPVVVVPTPAPPVAMVRSEPQPSYPGSVLLATVRRITVADTATPRPVFIVSAEPPRPYAGLAITRGLSRGPFDFSLAGIQYRIYANTGAGDPVDYTVAVATTFGLTWTSGALAFPADWKFAVRAYDVSSGKEERNVDALVRLKLDGSGMDCTACPDAPSDLSGHARAAGAIMLDWAYALVDPDRAPTGFHVYRGTGGTPSYATPVATVAYTRGVIHFTATVAGGSDGTAYTFGIRAYNATGEETNVAKVTVTADATGPSAVLTFTGTATS